MSYISRNNSTTSLMGFSVHQPAIGAPLQFFPAMGSKHLDEMIDAYVPGTASIIDKRATVSVEFFEHSMATGEFFKFFMVYPSLGSATESPASSMLDSGYASNFTSPIMSERHWTQTSHALNESKSQNPSSNKASISIDFSHLPGMKIMTRDGKDVTNSASRGCKTKEQRDHAHLMRIIKACDSCRRKKIRCDPSHKRSAGSSGAKNSRKAKKMTTSSAPSSAQPPQLALEPLGQPLDMPSLDLANMGSSSSFNSAMPESLVDTTMDWDQFVQFDEESTDVIPYDYDFFLDPAGHLSPTSSNSFSSQPITPAQILDAQNTTAGTVERGAQTPLPPYLNPGGEVGNDYADFNLYSPGSSTYLDDDPSLTKEIAAMAHPEYSDYLSRQRPLDNHRRDITGHDPDSDTRLSVNTDLPTSFCRQEQEPSPIGLDTLSYHQRIYRIPTQSSDTPYSDSEQIDQVPEWRVPARSGKPNPWPPVRTSKPQSQHYGLSPRIVGSLSPAPLGATLSSLQESQYELSSPPTGLSQARPSKTRRQGQQSPTSASTSSNGALNTMSANFVSHETVVKESSATSNPMSDNKTSVSSSTVAKSHTTDTPLLFLSGNCSFRTTMTISLVHKIAMLGIVKKDDLLARTTLSASSFRPNEAVLPSVILVSALSAMALHVLSLLLSTQTVLRERTSTKSNALLLDCPDMASGQTKSEICSRHRPVVIAPCLLALVLFGYALVDVSQRRFLSNKAKETEITPISIGSLSTGIAHITTRDRIIPRTGMLDLATQSLSFVREIPIAITNGIKSRYIELTGDFSRIRSGFKRELTFRPRNRAGGVFRLQRIASLAW